MYYKIFGISGQLRIAVRGFLGNTYNMISVENFYWTLWQNLLDPVGLDCFYYYPLGTKDYLSKFEFNTGRQWPDHVFFHFEQEPLWSSNLGRYDNDGWAWSSKFLRVLANSEKSDLKKNICQSRGALDWYFFFHGFAALDWYRDTKYITRRHDVNDAFLSLNHVFDRRAYRAALLARMIDKDIVHKGSVSFHTTLAEITAELSDPATRLSSKSQALIKNTVNASTDLPWRLDDVPINGTLSARFGNREYALWQSSLLHIVNETVFDDPKLHLTEKTFKPIVSQRPFLLVSAPGNLEYLRSYGFKTFGQWIDESYDQIQDPDQRLDAIANEISRFARMSVYQLRDVCLDMEPVLQFNKQHFFGEFREIIVDELVENFDTCIRIWNNGRVDGRELPLHPDLNSAKQILLR